MLPISDVSNTTKTILAGLRESEESIFIKTDPLMKKLAEKFSMELGHDDEQHSYIRTKLREVARVVLTYRRLTQESDASLTDMIDPSKFTEVGRATRISAGFDEQTHLYLIPSLAIKVGYTLKKCADLLLGEALMKDDKTLETRARSFGELYRMKWSELVTKNALRTLREMKRNKAKILPLTEDVVKFTNHVHNCAEEEKKRLLSCSDPEKVPHIWRKLAESVLAAILVFNKKRQGEISKLTIEDFRKCSRGREDMITDGLSKWEKELCSIMWRVEIIGKKGNTVPVLLTDKLKSYMDTILHHRERAAILEDNKYMFPLHASLSYIRGADVLRKLSETCGAKHPQYIRSTPLRKHVAVLFQIMNLKENELDVLASFMGHDIRTHRQYYRLPDDIMQLAKVSKVLLKLESGDISSVAGKTLDEIELNEDEGNFIFFLSSYNALESFISVNV